VVLKGCIGTVYAIYLTEKRFKGGFAEIAVSVLAGLRLKGMEARI